ncbi:sec-independent protein translocase protein TatA [Pseudomonas citronellolis]|uniref:Sec-independent protein translocase protein TatA n=1 Tax=Pseudomonas citronellolis TaxID=53408 RepID=A0AAQ1QYC8_9PSED|nr:twin-arginine translocase TatA/TatE family subunit [Pseudomonas citronellolis]MCP1642496.1 sec-independent protein translocase protein TatA [Pseudomonas citronellolis]MCP1665393.1 sec-independent protein translocase protein TatA [Pseudomonas citronellolis]MCP1696329.1 sec-independent protein translocase protein TatA [Pseudomonas citronellolis]MCP1702930.1 sec-independent protein translocase protein TatA [Pseudomonas citronellolis]MCP1797109.1 sec-independent protein translocase protein TatA
MGIFDWKHWLVLLLVALLVFGSKRVKHLGSDLGEAIKGFRRSVNAEDEPAAQKLAGEEAAAEPRRLQESARQQA